ncbi:MAG TPA: septum formation inhibitor Maf [Firmicutes bacterium]|jgi:septum formation protein|nr:MAG: hypothetical protein AA931_00770 [Peptococcaceae bacterium 1109]HHT73489.1 septum formation inhibitor Maf [Bacillota bacterium]
MEIILASKSPRRAQLLRQFGLDFRVAVGPAQESSYGNPQETAVSNGLNKAVNIAAEYPQALTIGADTVVVLDGRMLGKPSDAQEAEAMLRALSGRAHEVVTGVALCPGLGQARTFAVSTRVKFRPLSEQEIKAYVKTGEPLDKAGAYGIQGMGGLFVEGINGCYFNVVGLPMPRLVLELRAFGIDVFD